MDVTMSEWINSADELPPENQLVLICSVFKTPPWSLERSPRFWVGMYRVHRFMSAGKEVLYPHWNSLVAGCGPSDESGISATYWRLLPILPEGVRG